MPGDRYTLLVLLDFSNGEAWQRADPIRELHLSNGL